MTSSSRRHNKSQRKHSGSAKSFTEAPAPSFLFSVTELPLNPEYPERHEPESNQWLPPLERSGFRPPPQVDQYMYRYTSDAAVSRADSYIWANRRWEISGSVSAADLTVYRATSTFWCNPFFMTSTCDPTIYDMKDEPHPHNRWWPLTFEHNGPVSRVQESAERDSLRGTGNRWVSDCGLQVYLRSSSSNTSALAGTIGTIIGLIALSCRSGQLSTALLTDQAWYCGCWYGHQQGPGRTENQRGVVVNVYFDPENPSSTRPILEAIESQGGPLLRAID